MSPEPWIDDIHILSHFIQNFDFKEAFWKPINGVQTMKVLYAKDVDRSHKII